MTPRESIEFDVVIVGAGPAGLAAACRLGQLSEQREARGQRPLQIAIVEKAAAIGGHIVSGAVLDPRALDELFSDWRDRGAPVHTLVKSERLLWLRDERRSLTLPQIFVPRSLRSKGHYIISLGALCEWLGEQAEAAGVHVFAGFAATQMLYEDGRVAGIVTGDRGVGRDGEPKPVFEPGYELRAHSVLLAEGCRGHLGREVIERFALDGGKDPQHYGLGFKERWQLPVAGQDPAEAHKPTEAPNPGEIIHTFGWPLGTGSDSGGFLYHADNGEVMVGYVVALDYANPSLDPFAEFQRFKDHPAIRCVLEQGTRTAYGARALNKGGWQSLPRLQFPGGLLIGCDAGFLNPARIKGIDTAMKSGMLAAEAVAAELGEDHASNTASASFEQAVAESWLGRDLRAERNFSPLVKRFGALGGGMLAFLEQTLLRGRAPWTLSNRRADRETLKPLSAMPAIDYPPPDSSLRFDRMSSVYLANIAHEEDQPVHLKLADPALPVSRHLPEYGEPARLYCPAGVYEIVAAAEESRFQINAANCIHCKACDIKDPSDNIRWVPPEGGSGPNYERM